MWKWSDSIVALDHCQIMRTGFIQIKSNVYNLGSNNLNLPLDSSLATFWKLGWWVAAKGTLKTTTTRSASPSATTRVSSAPRDSRGGGRAGRSPRQKGPLRPPTARRTRRTCATSFWSFPRGNKSLRKTSNWFLCEVHQIFYAIPVKFPRSTRMTWQIPCPPWYASAIVLFPVQYFRAAALNGEYNATAVCMIITYKLSSIESTPHGKKELLLWLQSQRMK